MHLRPLVLALVMAAAGCAAPPTWREAPGLLEHVPSGLSFPDSIEGLARAPVAPHFEAEAAISYVSGRTTGLRILLSPMATDVPIDLEAVLAGRALGGAAAHPARGHSLHGSFAMHCGPETVTFAYRSSVLESPTVAKPPEGYTLDVGGTGTKLDWWFATELSGHLVVLESRISDRADSYYGADLTLRDLLIALGWPCTLPTPKREAEADRVAPPERSWKQTAEVLLARALPVRPFDESSTFGPRPVVPEPAPGTYAHARTTGKPHTCKMPVPTFFGEREVYETYVNDDDFLAPGRLVSYARVDGIAYAWFEGELTENETPGLAEHETPLSHKVRLADFNRAYEKLWHHLPPRWDSLFAFAEPADRDLCTPTTPQKIELPEREFRDLTEELVASQREAFLATVDVLEALPFAPLLPHSSLLDLFPRSRGHAMTLGYSVTYVANGTRPGAESSQLTIGFRMHTEGDPASRCGKQRLGPHCEHFATTGHGHEVFREPETVGSSSSNPRLPHYYAQVGDALVRIGYISWRSDPGRPQEWRAHEFEPGEIEQLFDSLQPASPEAVARFPGMGVGR